LLCFFFRTLLRFFSKGCRFGFGVCKQLLGFRLGLSNQRFSVAFSSCCNIVGKCL